MTCTNLFVLKWVRSHEGCTAEMLCGIEAISVIRYSVQKACLCHGMMSGCHTEIGILASLGVENVLARQIDIV